MTTGFISLWIGPCVNIPVSPQQNSLEIWASVLPRIYISLFSFLPPPKSDPQFWYVVSDCFPVLGDYFRFHGINMSGCDGVYQPCTGDMG